MACPTTTMLEKSGVTLEKISKFCEASTRLAFIVGKLGLKGCFAELEASSRRIGRPKGGHAISFNFTRPRDVIETSRRRVYVASGITAPYKKIVSAEAKVRFL